MNPMKKQLDKIPETMLITLWAKAEETKQKVPLLRDETALGILSQIDYDFSKFKKSKFTQAGVCIRANLIDKEAKTFIENHPDAVVIQLGTGLDARYERLGSPCVTHWYDLDLPESIALRKQFFRESPSRTFLPISMFDYSWIDKVLAHQKPVLIIVEGVFMYFEREMIQNFFNEICKQFDKTTVLFDMLAFVLVGNAKKHDSLGAMSEEQRPEFKWSEKYAKDMEQWNPKIHIEKELFMSDYDQKRFPFLFRMFYKIPYFYRTFNQRIIQIGIN
ncbi:MAG: class I SAM-dependent methyltransferase [Capnocytophaga sp.]|nr:class I SAM-dependent methyltransferase [Capnocytophaga sp.]